MVWHRFDGKHEVAGAGESIVALTPEALAVERHCFQGTGGESSVCRGHGFGPAFRDEETGRVYRALYRDGSQAPMHLLDGLPDEVVRNRDAHGHVIGVKSSLVSGFLHRGCFYTRDEAATLLAA